MGLYLATDRFAGNLLELEVFPVGVAKSFRDFAPYQADDRGIVALKAGSTVAIHQTEAA